VRLIGNRQLTSNSRNSVSFGTNNETLSVAIRISSDGSLLETVAFKANFLKQAEQFENNYDNNNYSNYVEDASVHALTEYQIGFAVASIYAN
jgi:hypothetical protein